MSKSTEHSKAIMDSLRKMVQALRHSSAQCEEFSGLTGAQFFVLKQIELGGDLSMNELATLTYTHQSTVSEVVSKLEASKLVVRSKSQIDGRRVEIRITKKGLDKLSSGFLTTQEKLMQAIKSLSPDKVSHLASLLDELTHVAGLSEQAATFFFENNATSNENNK